MNFLQPSKTPVLTNHVNAFQQEDPAQLECNCRIMTAAVSPNVELRQLIHKQRKSVVNSEDTI